MSSAPVTAVTVNYNAGPLLQGLVESLAGQPGLLRTVVVDNDSSDASLDFLAAAPHPALTLVRNPVNRGFGAACNQGAASAAGRYLLFINPDCRMQANALGRLSALLDANPELGMV